MECPNCGTELRFLSSFGNGAYIIYGDQSGKVGDIYECPSSDGFEDDELASSYLENIGESLDSLGVDSLGEVSCENAQGNRHYYTDQSGSLREGHPC